METLGKDVRYALKLLGRDRAFTIAAVLTFALCVGANAAIFGVVNTVLVRPLPYANPDELVTMYNSYPNAGVTRAGNAATDYDDRKREIPALATVAIWQEQGVTVTEPGSPERVSALRVSPSLFPLLGVAAARGRTFTPEEETPDQGRVVVISHGFWQERFGGREDILGQTMRIGGNLHEVVGVMPPGFLFESHKARLWLPIVITPGMLEPQSRHNNNFGMIGRLTPGATIEQARAQLDELRRRHDQQFPQFRDLLAQAGFTSNIAPYHADLTRDVRGTLVLLQVGVLVVLLIGCVNIANLILVRAIGRSRELATRSALGAGFGRLTRQLVTESILLALIGGIAGLVLGYGALRAFARLGLEQLPRGAEVGMDAPVFIITLLLSLLAGAAFGLIPALRVRRADLNSVFREDGRSATASRSTLLTRGSLVVAQVALAFALLVGAGLTLASFVRTSRIDPGFQRENILTASIQLPATRYADSVARLAFFEDFVRRASALPGVRSVGLAAAIPFGDQFSASVVTPEGHTRREGESAIAPSLIPASPGHFETLGIRLSRGRLFDETDRMGTTPVVVIDEALARLYWPDEDPIGRRMFIGAYDMGMPDEAVVMRTIVGVVRSVRTQGLVGEQPPGQFYLPFAQVSPGRAFVTVRTAGDPSAMINALRAQVSAIDPELPLADARTLNERISESLTTERARMVLLVGFASIALLLAAIGLYGVLAYSVAQRRAEIGIRLALGSSTQGVFALVLRQGLTLVAIGLLIGLAMSAGGTRLLQGMLYGVSALDPSVFAGVLVMLSLVAAAACLLPAWRATRVDPAVALREG